MFCTAGYIYLKQGSLLEGNSVASGLSIVGLIFSGIFIGLGAHLAYAGFET